jgi:uncharacterized repeat protein (TIGR04138 family)
VNNDSSPNPDQNAPQQPAGTPGSGTPSTKPSAKPGMPPIKVTWKTSITEAKAHAAKLDAEIAAMNAPVAVPPSSQPGVVPLPTQATAAAVPNPAVPTAAAPTQAEQLALLASRWKLAQQEYGEYHPLAYQFVRECVRHTVEMIHGLREREERESTSLATPDPTRHVSAQQLCYGLKDLAIDRYGGMSLTVLRHWGIRTTRDVGNIVFAMLAVGILGRSENDSLEQFEGVFDFGEEFAFSA